MDLREDTPVASELLELHAESTSLHTHGVTSNLKKFVPKMKIAMVVVGTRGDVQPFLAVAKRLQACLKSLFCVVKTLLKFDIPLCSMKLFFMKLLWTLLHTVR